MCRRLYSSPKGLKQRRRGRVLVPPFLLSGFDSCTSAIIGGLSGYYKQFPWSAQFLSSLQFGGKGISARAVMPLPLKSAAGFLDGQRQCRNQSHRVLSIHQPEPLPSHSDSPGSGRRLMDGRACVRSFSNTSDSNTSEEKRKNARDRRHLPVLGESSQTGNISDREHQETNSCRNLLCRRVLLLPVTALIVRPTRRAVRCADS